MKKLINLRIPLFLAVAFILGIYSCYEWYFGNFYFGLAVVLLLVVLTVVLAIKRHGAWKIALVTLIFAILGFGITRFAVFNMEKREVLGDYVTVTARVSDLNRNGSANGIYYLENCTLPDGSKLVGRVQLYTHDADLQTGDVVTVRGNLFSTYPIKSNFVSYLIRDKINYQLTNAEVVNRQQGALKFDEKVRKYIYDATHDYMLENGDVMYALLTGDAGAISNETHYAFSRAGILHLLAVSGLHVGFIVALICFVLKRFRLHPLLECAIVIVPLLFYAYVCAFTPSVMRAIVMVVCSYIARACFGKYDMLSSISWASLIILLVKPFYLFDVGFQLSFLSVYGIATLYSQLNRLLNRRKINRFFRYFVNSLVLSLSCVIATFFTVALNYGEVPVFSALLNVIVIPLVSVVFTLGIFGLIPSVFHYLLLVADYILRAVVALAHAVSQISFATVVVYAVAISSVIVVVLLFVLGGFVNVNKLGKRIFYPICAILLVFSMTLSFIPKSKRNEVFISVGEDSVAIAAVSQSGEGALVLDSSSPNSLRGAIGYLRQFKLTGCTLYVAYCGFLDEYDVAQLMSLPIDKVYVLATDGNDTMEQEFAERGVSVVHPLPNSTTGNSIKVQTHFGAYLTGVSITVDEIDVCLARGGAVDSLIESGIVADVFVLPDVDAGYCKTDFLIITPYQINCPHNYGANKYGNFTIKQKSGNMYLSFR